MKTNIVNIANRDFVVLTNTDGIPLLMANFYLITQKRNLSLKRLLYISTVLKRLYDFFKLQNKNLENILIDGEYDYLLKNIHNFFQNYKALYNLGNDAFNIHIFFTEDYVIWALKRYLLKTCDYQEKIQLEDYYLEKFSYLFRSFYTISRQNTDFKSIDEAVLLDVIDSYKQDNFNSVNYLRNLIILQLLVETGMRIGEVLNLKTSDIFFSENSYIKIVDSKTFSLDTRYDKPNLKNNHSSRIIFISKNLSGYLQHYILSKRRSTYKGENSKINHPFIFTSKRGSPLSKSSIQILFNQLNKYNLNPLIKITPHKFRHSFAFAFLKYLVEIKKNDLSKAQDELRKICGWSPRSQMPQFYAGKYIWELANKHNIERINKRYYNE